MAVVVPAAVALGVTVCEREWGSWGRASVSRASHLRPGSRFGEMGKENSQFSLEEETA